LNCRNSRTKPLGTSRYSLNFAELLGSSWRYHCGPPTTSPLTCEFSIGALSLEAAGGLGVSLDWAAAGAIEPRRIGRIAASQAHFEVFIMIMASSYRWNRTPDGWLEP